MKSNPYENSPYTSDPPIETSTQPLPPPPSLPAEGRESVLALILALLSAFTANSLLFGGLALGSALGIFGIFTATALYLLVKTKHFGWYPLACLVCSLILVASFPRSSDGTVKSCLLLLAFTAYLLGLSQVIWAPFYPAGRMQSLNGAGRALFLTPYPQIFPALRGLFASKPPRGSSGGRLVASYWVCYWPFRRWPSSSPCSFGQTPPLKDSSDARSSPTWQNSSPRSSSDFCCFCRSTPGLWP